MADIIRFPGNNEDAFDLGGWQSAGQLVANIADPVVALGKQRRSLLEAADRQCERMTALMVAGVDEGDPVFVATQADCEAAWADVRDIEAEMIPMVATALQGIEEQVECLRDFVSEPEFEPLIDGIIAGLRGLSASAGDDTLRGLFRRWIRQERRAERIGNAGDGAGHDAAIEMLTDLEHEIARAPAAGAIGLAVKAYLLVHHYNDGSRNDAPALGPQWRAAEVEQVTTAHLSVSLIHDLGQFVPEIGPLITRFVDEPEPGAA